MKRKTIMLILAAVMLVSCVSTKETTKAAMDSWLGSTKKSLIFQWGAPSRVTSDGDSGEVLVYEKQTYNAYYKITFYAIRMFYVDSKGIIYYWKSETGSR